MASFDPIDYDPIDPVDRQDRPFAQRGLLLVFLTLGLIVATMILAPTLADRIGYNFEAGRARAAAEALEGLDEAGTISRASALFRLASQAVKPSVVNVRAERLGIPQGPGNGFGRRDQRFTAGSGSGVVIDKDQGFIVTNHHVIDGADEIVVRLGGRTLKASLVGSDQKTDLAVIQVQVKLPAEAAWGDSEKLDIGDWVLAIGSPFELDQTVTAGIVSATGRGGLPLPAGSYQDFIQTDAAINPGNSGGPLINLRGEIVGINTAILSETGIAQGVGLSISSKFARQIVEQLISQGRVVRGYLGVRIRDVEGPDLKGSGLEEPTGALIEDVVSGGPADQAGLLPQDIIVMIGDEPVTDSDSLRNRTITLPLGETSALTIYREGRRQTIDVVIEAMPVLLDLGLIVVDPDELRAAGFLDQAIPGLNRRRPDRRPVILDVMPGSPAAFANLQRGWRLTHVDEVPIPSLEVLNDVAAARYQPDKGLALRVQTLDGELQNIVISAR